MQHTQGRFLHSSKDSSSSGPDIEPPRGAVPQPVQILTPSCLPGSAATLLSMTKTTPSSLSRSSRRNMSSTPPTGMTSPTQVGLMARGPLHPDHLRLRQALGAQNGPELTL